MNLPSDLNGWLALVGGVSGAAILCYSAIKIYYARRQDQHLVELKIQQARMEGMILALLITKSRR